VEDTGISDGSQGFDFGGAEFFVHGLYTDTLLLALLQKSALLSFRERLFEARKHGLQKSDLQSLESDLVDFRAGYWRTDFAPQGSEDDFLTAYQTIFGLPAILEELRLQISEYASQFQRREQEITNGVLYILAFLGLPTTIALTVWAGIEGHTPAQLWIYGSCVLAFSALFLIIPGIRQPAWALLRKAPQRNRR